MPLDLGESWGHGEAWTSSCGIVWGAQESDKTQQVSNRRKMPKTLEPHFSWTVLPRIQMQSTSLKSRSQSDKLVSHVMFSICISVAAISKCQLTWVRSSRGI